MGQDTDFCWDCDSAVRARVRREQYKVVALLQRFQQGQLIEDCSPDAQPAVFRVQLCGIVGPPRGSERDREQAAAAEKEAADRRDKERRERTQARHAAGLTGGRHASVEQAEQAQEAAEQAALEQDLAAAKAAALNIIGFEPPLEDFGAAAAEVPTRVMSALRALPPLDVSAVHDDEDSAPPLVPSASAPPLQRHTAALLDARGRVRDSLRASSAGALALVEVLRRCGYERLLQLDPPAHARSFFEEHHRPANEGGGVDMRAFEAEIQAFRATAAEVASRMPSVIKWHCFEIECGALREELVARAHALSGALLELVRREMMLECALIDSSSVKFAVQITVKPHTIEQFGELQQALQLYTGTRDEVNALIQRVRVKMDGVERCQCSLEDDDSATAWEMFSWPRRLFVANVDALASTERLQVQFEEELELETEAFKAQLKTFEAKIEHIIEYGEESVRESEAIVAETRLLRKQLQAAEELSFKIQQRQAILEVAQTQFDGMEALQTALRRCSDLWEMYNEYEQEQPLWMDGPLNDINREKLSGIVEDGRHQSKACERFFENRDAVGPQLVARNLHARYDEFNTFVPLVNDLRNPGMRARHWDMVMDVLGVQESDMPGGIAKITLRFLLDHGQAMAYAEKIADVSEEATQEHELELALRRMEGEWQTNAALQPVFQAYRDSGTFLIRDLDDILEMLEEQVAQAQSMRNSPFVDAAFDEELQAWEELLALTQDTLDEYVATQLLWQYMKPIFGAEDITRQMPVLARSFRELDAAMLVQTVELHAAATEPSKSSGAHGGVLSFGHSKEPRNNFRKWVEELERIQRGLNEYLDLKRSAFPRFYFLSNDELLGILSHTKDPLKVNAHLPKCFDGIYRLDFDESSELLDIRGMLSVEGERIPLLSHVADTTAGGREERMIRGGKRRIKKLPQAIRPMTSRTEGKFVEAWLTQVEEAMRVALHEQFRMAIDAQLAWSGTSRPDTPATGWAITGGGAGDADTSSLQKRAEWLLEWPGQVVLSVNTLFWTKEVELVLQEAADAEERAATEALAMAAASAAAAKAQSKSSSSPKRGRMTKVKVQKRPAPLAPSAAAAAAAAAAPAAETKTECVQRGLRQYLKLLKSRMEAVLTKVRGPLGLEQRCTLEALMIVDVHQRDVTSKMSALDAIDFEWSSQFRYYWREEMGVTAPLPQPSDNEKKAKPKGKKAKEAAEAEAKAAEGAPKAVPMECEMMGAKQTYCYEYLGNSGRLVITPLTDRCYRTLMQATHLHYGGAPEGPAGTGKTETVKDLTKTIGNKSVVFNCSDSLDYIALGKFFKGLAGCGAWACFDEFNRISLDVLSVVAQQVSTLQTGVRTGATKILFEGTNIKFNCACNVFITMNPGYAGRTELPDNLKSLFRSIAMMVPDYAMIAEISLYSSGFGEARKLSVKLTKSLSLASEQVSSQDHYDFGMRTVKSCITAAAQLKLQRPNDDEEELVLQAICDCNVPKFTSADIAIFTDLTSDLFPNVAARQRRPSVAPAAAEPGEEADAAAAAEEAEVDAPDQRLRNALHIACREQALLPQKAFVEKCLHLQLTLAVRHGLMLVGRVYSGKTSCYRVLAQALSTISEEEARTRAMARGAQRGRKKKHSEAAEAGPVKLKVMNPKAQSMGQLYGEFDGTTHEWQDGVLGNALRTMAENPTDPTPKWAVLDGPVDAIWIENMNTVLDDNKKLCLNSGEIVKLSNSMTMIYEVENLAVASPATVSRCGMVFLMPEGLGWSCLVAAWMQQQHPKSGNCVTPSALPGGGAGVGLALELIPYSVFIQDLFDWILPDALAFVSKMRGSSADGELTPTTDAWLVASLLHLLGAYLKDTAASTGVGEAQLAGPGSPAQLMVAAGQMAELAAKQSALAGGNKPGAGGGGGGGDSDGKRATERRNSNVAVAAVAKARTAGEAHLAAALNCALRRAVEDAEELEAAIEAAFVFSLIWSVGGALGAGGREKFDAFLRGRLAEKRLRRPRPKPLKDPPKKKRRARRRKKNSDSDDDEGGGEEGEEGDEEEDEEGDEDEGGEEGEGDGEEKRPQEGQEGEEGEEEEEEERDEPDEALFLSLPAEGQVYDFAFDLEKREWVQWMDMARGKEVEADAAPATGKAAAPAADAAAAKTPGQVQLAFPADYDYNNIIVPTPESVRNSELQQVLLRHGRAVMFVGPTGTGKTISLKDKIANLRGTDFVPFLLALSSQMTPGYLQTSVEGQLDKRRRGVLGPPNGKQMVVFVDDLSMAQADAYNAHPPLELLRQWCDHGGWYERGTRTTDFRQIVDLVFASAMVPTTGGRASITQRYLRHFSVVSCPPFSALVLTQVFGAIAEWGFRRFDKSVQVPAFQQALVRASIRVYEWAAQGLRPTPSKPLYKFNVRDLSRMMQGLLSVAPSSASDTAGITVAWVHEATRVFTDRIADPLDTKAFKKELAAATSEELMNGEKGAYQRLVGAKPLIFGCFGGAPGSAAAEKYRVFRAHDALREVCVGAVATHNRETPGAPLNFVPFTLALDHIARVARVLHLDGGHMLLVGVVGCGRETSVRLATRAMGGTVEGVNLPRDTSLIKWRERIVSVLVLAGTGDAPLVFLMSDTEVHQLEMLSDLCTLLNGGDFRDWFSQDTLDKVVPKLYKKVLRRMKGRKPTTPDVIEFFLSEIRRRLHLVFRFDGVGEALRQYLVDFPALSNCCTVDWYTAWPEEALTDVAFSVMQAAVAKAEESDEDEPEKEEGEEGEAEEEVMDDEAISGAVRVSVSAHTCVEGLARQYQADTGRTFHVTPARFLQMLAIFVELKATKGKKILAEQARYSKGTQMLEHTETAVHGMQVEIEALAPVLIQKERETAALVIEVTASVEQAEITKKEVEVEELKAAARAAEAASISELCEERLGEALPALEMAIAALKTLKKSDLDEIRALKEPPAGVRLTMSAICVMMGKKPDMVVPKGKLAGQGKVADYWEPSKKLLANSKKLLDGMRLYDKDNIKEAVMSKINKDFIPDENFQPDKIRSASVACEGMCKWVRAMSIYEHVSKQVQPLRESLAAAQKEHADSLTALAAKQATLQAAMDATQKLQEDLAGFKVEQLELQATMDQCMSRKSRAGELLARLGDEAERWETSEQELGALYDNCLGDLLVTAATLTYLGFFNADLRAQALSTWLDEIDEANVPVSDDWSLQLVIGDQLAVGRWIAAGLPSDSLSVDNAVMVIEGMAAKYPLMIDPQGQAVKWVRGVAEAASLVQVAEVEAEAVFRSADRAVKTAEKSLQKEKDQDLGGANSQAPIDAAQQVLDGAVRRQQEAKKAYEEAKQGAAAYVNERELVCTKPSNRRFVREVEAALTSGQYLLIEDIQHQLPQVLQPILQKTASAGRGGTGKMSITVDGHAVRFDPRFKLFIASALAAPRLSATDAAMVSLVDFAITPAGLEEQLLGTITLVEREEDAQLKRQLMADSAEYKNQLKELEDKILELLNTAAMSGGNLLDDVQLVGTLNDSKQKSEEVSIALRRSEDTQKRITRTMEAYRPLAQRGSQLYFCISAMQNVDPFYTFSLPWTTLIYIAQMKGLAQHPSTRKNPKARVEQLVDRITSATYLKLMRSLFEKDKLLFSVLVCLRVLEGRGEVHPDEKRFLLTGIVSLGGAPSAGSPAAPAASISDAPPSPSKGGAAGAAGGRRPSVVGGKKPSDMVRRLSVAHKATRRLSNAAATKRVAGASAAAQRRASGQLTNPAPEWLSKRGWTELQQLSLLPAFKELHLSVCGSPDVWRGVAESPDIQAATLPGSFQLSLSRFQRLLLTRCLQPHRVKVPGLQQLVSETLGPIFIRPPPFDLVESFAESDATKPLMFVLSPGSDPLEVIEGFAKAQHMRMASISLGQGQEQKALEAIEYGVDAGTWVLLQNCHLVAKFLPRLQATVDSLDADRANPSFRLWLTSFPSKEFPVSVLQQCVKMVNEAPLGIRANMMRSYKALTQDTLGKVDGAAQAEAGGAAAGADGKAGGGGGGGMGGMSLPGASKGLPGEPQMGPKTARGGEYRKLLFGLCFFHAVVQERRKFGPIGWAIPYGFTDADMRVSAEQLAQQILPLAPGAPLPLEWLSYATGELNYGGRVTDAQDRRIVKHLLSDFFTDDILDDGYKLSESGVYYAPADSVDIRVYRDFCEQLPLNDPPEVFGMHENADLTLREAETYALLETVMHLQLAGGGEGGGGGKARETAVAAAANTMLSDLPPNFDMVDTCAR
jgi:MoxR-like ATPase